MVNEMHGIMTYDNNTVNANNFGAMIVADIDSIQYWRDRPLFLGYSEQWFSDAITWNNGSYQTYINNESILDYLEKLKSIDTGIDIYAVEADRIQTSIREYSKINSDTPPVDYPNPGQDPTDIELVDEDGNIIDTITTDMGSREFKDTSSGPQAITILDGLPEGYDDDQSPQELDETTIVTLPDSFIKDKMWVSQDYIPGLNQELVDSSAYMRDPLIDASSDLNYEQPDLVSINDDLSGPSEIWYGIPLINLSPKDTPLVDSIIVHLNTKNGYKLDITNIVGTGLESTSIMIDKVIPPGTKFSAGVTILQNRISLFLKISGDSTLYTSSVPLDDKPEMTISGFGFDNEFKKSLCGNIYDMRQWEFETDFNRDPDIIVPIIPKSAIVYNNSNGLVRGSKSFSTREGEPSANNGGNWWDMDQQWKAVYNGYLDRFFCRHILNNTDFTIMWYQYQLGYPPGIRTIMSDSVNEHYIKYDYTNFELIVEFKGTIQKIKILLPEFMWVQCSIRYSIANNQITFNFRETNQDSLYEYVFDVPKKITFQLMSMWARFSHDEARYVEIQKGAFTLLNIFTENINNDELDTYYQSHKKFLIPYDLKSIPREDLPL